MSITGRITADAILHRWQTAGSKDAAGDVVSSFAAGVPVKVELQQTVGDLGSVEMRDNKLFSVTRWVAFFRPNVTLDGKDELTVAGDRYSFDGEPWLVRHPRTGRTLHWQAKLKKVE